MKKILTFFSIILLSVSGCGYTTGALLPARLKTIYIAPFDNKIDYTDARKRQLYFPLLETDIHQKIMDEFLFDGNLRIAQEQNADLILRGTLINYERSALRFTDNDDVQEYRIHVTVSLELWDVQKDEAMWKESNFVGEATFFLTGAQATSERSAVQEAVADLADRVVERTIENW